MMTKMLLDIIGLLTKLIDVIYSIREGELRVLFDEFGEYLREKRRATRALPEHLTVQEVSDYLGKHRSSLYRNVIPDLLQPCKYIGNRPYFLKEDVMALMEEYPLREKGAHRFGKRPAKRQGRG